MHQTLPVELHQDHLGLWRPNGHVDCALDAIKGSPYPPLEVPAVPPVAVVRRPFFVGSGRVEVELELADSVLEPLQDGRNDGVHRENHGQLHWVA